MAKEKDESNRLVLHKLLARLKPYRGWIGMNLAASFGSAAVDVAGGFFIQSLTDAAIRADLQSVAKLVTLAGFVVVIGIQLKLMVKYTTGCFTGYAIYDIRAQVMDAIHRMSYSEIEKYHSGDIISRLSKDTYVVQSFFQNHFANLIYQPLVLIGVFAYLIVINWQLTAIIVFLTMVTIYGIGRLSKPIGYYAKQVQEGHGVVNALAQESINGIRTVKAYHLEDYVYQRFKAAVDQLFAGYIKKNKREISLSPLGFLTDLLPLLCTMTLGGWLAIRGEITLGSLMAFLYMLQYLSEPLANLPELIREVPSIEASINRIDALTDIDEERTGGTCFEPSPAEPVLEFKEISFAYHDKRPVLQDLSFTIPAKSKTAIVGKSGSGKSTLFKLISGFYQPQRGELRLYGHPYADWDLESLRSQISLVTQDAFLFPGTIMENLAYGRPGASEAELMEAAKIANAHEFIMSFPDGYQTLVGEGGSRLSGGQKQRLAIARAFLKNAPILLLDEPTSALDHGSESLVMEAIDRISADKTVIVVAHRLSTIQSADQILVLHEGRVVEAGNHEELLERKGYYYDLYQKQFNS